MTDNDNLTARLRGGAYHDVDDWCEDCELRHEAADRIDAQALVIEQDAEWRAEDKFRIAALMAENHRLRAPGVAYPGFKGEPYYYDDPMFQGGTDD